MPRKKEKPTHDSGLYCYRIRVRQPDGTSKQKAFYSSKSKADAIKKAEEWKATQEVIARTGIVPSDVRGEPFDRWARKWLEAYKRGTVKEHTFNFTYRSIVEKYLIPYLGDCPLGLIRAVDLQKYINEVRQPDGSPLAKSTLQKHILTIREIFERAEENMLIPRSPARTLALPTQAEDPAERPYWSEEMAEIAKAWAKTYEPDHVIYPGYNNAEGIVIILETGLRRSELCALEWGDIEWSRGLIHVQRAAVPTTGKIVLGGTKTKSSDRYIPVSDSFLDWLAALPRYGRYVIPGTDPEFPRSPSGWATSTAQIMHKLSADTKLPELTPHELRHSYGTILRERGVDIYTISRVMGHSSVGITEKVYVHNDIEVLRKNMQAAVPKKGKASTG